MTELIQQDLERIVKTLGKYPDIEAIYLFGSYAYGMPTDDSDLDIAVICNDRSTRILDLMRKYGYDLADAVDMPMDLLVYYPEEFMARANMGITMESTILNKGVKL